ncbi:MULTISPECIES: hypothetical protein [unclassified Aerococcus]|uniref:hypothetical protein n=1 Tax=unclassified Aerococcus TaxID=2618060 RepID=UPI0025C36747|nr:MULTISPECIES: hypothetical protein [unclassified Aerococcus]
MNIQERIEALETEFAEKIEALKVEAQQEEEFPQYGDEYWYISLSGSILCEDWVGVPSEKRVLEVGNVYKTKEEAEFAAEKLRVEAELRKLGKHFENGKSNIEFYYDHEFDGIMFNSMKSSQTQGAIYFESEEKAQQAIESVGKERIKKYLFGVED